MGKSKNTLRGIVSLLSRGKNIIAAVEHQKTIPILVWS